MIKNSIGCKLSFKTEMNKMLSEITYEFGGMELGVFAINDIRNDSGGQS